MGFLYFSDMLTNSSDNGYKENNMEEEVEEVEVEEEVEEEIEEVEKKEEEVDPPESDRFSLPEEEQPADDLTEIVHQGTSYKFTKDKIVELAQKGFDYDTKVGQHGKIAQMIDSDPELSNVVSEYWRKKAEPGKFEIKPMDNYEDESEWLSDNLQQAMKAIPKPQPRREQPNVMDALKMRDPEHSNTVLPKLGEYAAQLSVRDYQRIDSDMGALCQFYDFVKEKETGKVASREVESPGFRIKSGGSAPKKSEPVSPWNLSKVDFQKQLDKIKGYS